MAIQPAAAPNPTPPPSATPKSPATRDLGMKATPARWRTSWCDRVRVTPLLPNVKTMCSIVEPWPDSITRRIRSCCFSVATCPVVARLKMSSGSSSL